MIALDGRAGDWVNARLSASGAPGFVVGRVVPRGFDRVVRVLHPAGERTWAEVAQESGTVAHPRVQWCAISPGFDRSGRTEDEPQEGSVPTEVQQALLDHLPGAELVYAVWDGFGAWDTRVDEAPLMPGWGGRSYRLFRGPATVSSSWPGMSEHWPQSANLVWPTDRAWCLATEIDWDSTLLACDAATADTVLADERLEAFEVAYDDDLSWYGDDVNPRPSWLPATGSPSW